MAQFSTVNPLDVMIMGAAKVFLKQRGFFLSLHLFLGRKVDKSRKNIRASRSVKDCAEFQNFIVDRSSETFVTRRPRVVNFKLKSLGFGRELFEALSQASQSSAVVGG